MRLKQHTILPRILHTVANGLVAVASSAGHTSRSAYQAFRVFHELQEISAQRLRQSVRYAIDKQYIVITRKKGKPFIELSAKGRRLLGREALEALQPKVQKKWDKLYRIILFDIPESHKTSRDRFASGLKKIGCIQIQKSAFAFPYPCFEEVEVLVDFYEVEDFITYVEASSLKPSTAFKKHFKL